MNEVAGMTATTVPQYKLLCKQLLHRINPEQTIENHIIIANLLLFQLHIALIPQLQHLQWLQSIFSRSAGQRAVQVLYRESILKKDSLTPMCKTVGQCICQRRIGGSLLMEEKKRRGNLNQSESSSLAPAGISSLFWWGIWPLTHVCGAFVSARVQLVKKEN